MFQVSSVRDLQTWADNLLDVTTEQAERVARAIWDRGDFPHPVNNTDLTDYLSGLPDEWLYAQAASKVEMREARN